MKKAVSFILALILVSMLLLPVGAEENASSMLVTKGALTYAIDDNFTIVACDPAVHVKDCTLPGIIDGYKVVRIGKDAFKDCTLLTDIKILEETTDIDEGAFSGCTALTKIFIPSSMVSIGEGAFSRCTNLTDVYYAGTEEQRGGITLGAGNDSFLSATWHYNYDYERPNLPDDMIGKEGLLIYTVNDDGTSCAIRDCEESVSGTYEIPEEIDGYKVTKIKDVAFYECSTLAKLVIPSGVKYIGDSAFDGCTALTEVNIPQNVSYIGPSAFNNCTSLKNITIPDGIQDIDYFSFSGCDSLQSVTLSTSVTEIEDGAFSGCPNLTYVYYAGTEEQKNTIYFGSDNEDILTATWIYESDTPDEQKFTVGRDDFSFLNEEKYFFDATVGDCIKIQGTYTIRASVGLHGTISPAGYVAVDAGGTQTFTFTPDEGYAVEHVKVNGKNKGEITDYTFKKVKKDQEIEVTFREKTEQDSEPKEKRGYGPIIDWILSIIEWIKHWFQA